jgi:4-hydroxybenzoate polyprenyltransferase
VSPFLKLIRFPNLLMIAFAQYMMRYAVVYPLIRLYGVDFRLSGFIFFCIVFSTICTAAAGFVINDYFDIKTDKINRPGKVVVGKTIDRRSTMKIHIILCATGILLGGFVTWEAGIPKLVLIYILVSGMLWLYSLIYKRQFLIGNIIVALFTALVPMIALLDIPPIYKFYGQFLIDQGANFNFAIFWILSVAGFTFLTTLSYEIIKDAEDFEGDVAYGCRSLPIVLGDRYTKWTIIGINMAVVGLLAFVYGCFLRAIAGYFSFFYILLLLAIPLVLISWKVYQATISDHYRQAGYWMNLVRLAGIVYCGVLLFFP